MLLERIDRSDDIERKLRNGGFSAREMRNLFGLDLQAHASSSPAFNLTTTGIGIESTYSVAATPTIFLSAQDAGFAGTNDWIERQSARGNVGREEASTGTFTGAGSMTIECEPDTFGAVLALASGTEQVTANVANPTAQTVTTTTTGPTTAGAYTVIPVTANTNIAVGDWYTIDTSTNAEPVQVASKNGLLVTVYATTKNHASGVSFVNAAVPLAYDHVYTLGSPRKSFTAQRNRITDAVNFTGNKISSIDITAANRALATARIATVYANEANVGSPTTASYSTLYPFRFNDPGNTVTVQGTAADAGIMGFTMTLNNGLQAAEYVFGGGRFINAIPEGQARVNGSMTLQFTSQTAQQRFWGTSGSTGPQSVVQPVNVAFYWQGVNYVNRAVRYGLTITLPKVKFTTTPVAGRQGGLLTQTVNYEAYSTGLQTNDDVSFKLTNTQSSAT